MYLLEAKLGSNTTPTNPRSATKLTSRETNGVGRSTPFLITRRSPSCSQIKIRPSGANAMVVGFNKPPTTHDSTKPEGKVVARTGDKAAPRHKSVSSVAR